MALATVAPAGGVHAQQGTFGATPPTQGEMASTLQALPTADRQFAATLATLAFVSGGLTMAQANTTTTVVRNAPAGLAVVNDLLSSNLTGSFGLATTNSSGPLIANLVVAENQDQTQASPN